MMGRQDRDQGQLFYEFSLDDVIPTDHLLRRINVFATAVLADLHEQLKAFYGDIGRPSVDPELMIRMLLSVTAMAFVMSAQAAEGDLAFRSVLGVDGESQQARAVRVWAQLSHRRRARSHCRR
jgi:transposase